MLDYIITQRLIGKIFVGGAIKDDYFTSFCVLSVFKISLMCVYGFFFCFFCFFVIIIIMVYLYSAISIAI